jgi:hypothetical protein
LDQLLKIDKRAEIIFKNSRFLSRREAKVIPRSQPRERIAVRDISTEAVDWHEPMTRILTSLPRVGLRLNRMWFLEPGKVCGELFIGVRRRPCMTLVPAALMQISLLKDHRVAFGPCRMQAKDQRETWG